jgi:hypothetical protein
MRALAICSSMNAARIDGTVKIAKTASLSI